MTCLVEEVHRRGLSSSYVMLLVLLITVTCLFWSENKDIALLNLVSYFSYNMYYTAGSKRPLYNPQLHYITLHYIALHYITLHYITLHYITLHYITLHYITLHYITLHYITLHYITLHYITLHYITLHSSSYVMLPHVRSTESPITQLQKSY